MISLLPYLIVAYIGVYSSDYKEQDWYLHVEDFSNFRLAHFRRAFRLVFKSRTGRVLSIELTLFQSDALRGKEFICRGRQNKCIKDNKHFNMNIIRFKERRVTLDGFYLTEKIVY